MDSLLRQLRQSMAELSIQGEDFARQMWQMYAIFEEFVDNHMGWNHSVNHQSSTDTEETSPSSRSQPSDMRENLSSDLLCSPELTKDVFGSPVRERQCVKLKSDVEVCNPLLETISTIENLGESEDYRELPECYLKAKSRLQEKHSATSVLMEGDKDSIGYAGSNSIDSGYKSSCPTPELSDGSIYGGESNKLPGSFSSMSKGLDSKPRIAMGTRVMHRQPHLPQSPSRIGTGFQDSDLDHLMYLRQTILSAMQQCEYSTIPRSSVDAGASQKPQWSSLTPTERERFAFPSSVDITHPRRMPSPTLGSRQLRTPSPRPQRRLRRVSSPSLSTWSHPCTNSLDLSGIPAQNYDFLTYQNTMAAPVLLESKTTTDWTSTVKSLRADSGGDPVSGTSGCSHRHMRPPSPVPSSPNHFQKTVRFSMEGKSDGNMSNSQTSLPQKSKPILKDPICASLHSQLEQDSHGVTVATLEEEIDTLLYGRTSERRQSSSDQELPCSYVTMIEDKYRKSSVAKVKKLREKTSPHTDHSSEPEHSKLSTSMEGSPSSEVPTSRADISNRDSSVEELTSSRTFSEVAQCMLDIIGDLHRQRLADNHAQHPGSNGSQPAAHSNSLTGSEPSLPSAASSHCENAPNDRNVNYDSQNRLSGADYHLYEEIVYDLAPLRCSKTKAGHLPPPPPLPKRPDGGLAHRGISKDNCEPSLQPKQRLNLYSLFREQSDRRSIALSLEQEWRLNRERRTAHEDEYGFRVLTHPPM